MEYKTKSRCNAHPGNQDPFRDIMFPLGYGNLTMTAIRNWSEYIGLNPNEAERKTNNAGNEAGLTYNENQKIVANYS
ncbi:MAG: hypothetical protein A2Y58_05540 [Chloroflexi bacterium RBG_13_51_52]|nr:MAG: hypothetical protein A2Y58_05540 [Chloroflexi bacterium RBG_13_51_52]